VGDRIDYTLTATVTRAHQRRGHADRYAGQWPGFRWREQRGNFTCNAANPLVCTLPAGTVPGTYSLTYGATVNAQASGSAQCRARQRHRQPVVQRELRYHHAGGDTGGELCQVGEQHRSGFAGDRLTYTLTTVVTNSRTTDVVTLTDTLGTGLDFGAVTSAGAYTAMPPIRWCARCRPVPCRAATACPTPPW
jgi:hypothetical protein